MSGKASKVKNEKPDPTKSSSSSSASTPPRTVIMSTIGVLQPFNRDRDDFEMWVGQFRSFLAANDLDASSAKDKCRAVFLSSLGLPTYTLLTTLLAPDAPTAKTLDELVTTLKEHFQPAPKAIAERFKFMGRRQRHGESVSQFVAELRMLATHCKFTDLEDRLRDQLIFGLNSESAQRTLFTKKDDIKLSEVIQSATAHEAAEASTSLVRGNQQSTPQPPPEQVNKNRSQQKKNWKNKQQPQQQQGGKGKHNENGKSNSNSCPNCGSNQHTTARECPHKNVKCHNCGKKGHFACLCRKPQSANNVDIVEISKIYNVRKNKNIIIMKTKINDHHHDMELDTACGKATLSIDFWKSIGSPKLKKSNVVFRSYTKTLFYPIGEYETTIEHNGQKIQHSIPVVDGSSLFGRDLLQKFKIDWEDVDAQCNQVEHSDPSTATAKSLVREFSDVFKAPTAEDRIRHFKAKVVLKDDAQPKFLKARDVPYALRDKVDRELDLMEQTGVIERVQYSEWASPLVVVGKPNGRVRITGDYKNTVNNQLCITQYPLAVPEDLFVKISGGNTYSKLDGHNAYHQLELDEASKQFLVINTHRGLYRYNVLPQGIASSPAIFQEFMDKMLHDIPKTGSFIDDCITTGSSDADHIKSLREIFERMRYYNYKLNNEKCDILKDKVTFLGHRVSKAGIETCSEKIETILSIPEPRDVSALSSFLGLSNFYGKFVPEFATVCEPLYRLTRSNVQWKWTKECRDAFRQVKQLLTTTPVLTHFDPSLPIGLATDASKTSVGMVLFHRYPDGSERPISYASKVLSETQRRYSQIEKEGLSIIYGIQKYFKFLCGRKFLLVTDAKPLVSIFGPKTQLPAYAATRLHHWAVYLSQFQYEVIYRKTTEHGNADALSRLPTTTVVMSAVKEETEEIVNSVVIEQLEILPVTAQEIRKATSRDTFLSRVLQFQEQGWPNQLQQEDAHLQPFFSRRTELTIVQGVLLWGIRVVIPSKLQDKILQQLHTCHLGIVKMKNLARQHVWWPNLDADIEKLAKSCQHCQETSPSPASAPLHPWQFPEREWQRLHADLAGPFLGKMWLILVDARSKWPEVFIMGNDTTSASVKTKLLKVFARFGLPQQIVTDNGRQFISDEFSKFLSNNGIKHILSSVYHPRSNGEAERFVRTFKEGMKGGKDGPVENQLQRFLFHYRATPHSTTGVSPAELLQSRKLRTALDLVHPDVHGKVATSQANQERNYNQRVKYRELNPDQPVWVRTFSKNEEKWTLGTTTRALGPVTYLVNVGGKSMKRHIDHLRPAARKEANHDALEHSSSGSPSATPQSSPQRQQQQRAPSRQSSPINSPERLPRSQQPSPSSSTAATLSSPPPSSPPRVVEEAEAAVGRPKRITKPVVRLQYNKKGGNM